MDCLAPARPQATVGQRVPHRTLTGLFFAMALSFGPGLRILERIFVGGSFHEGGLDAYLPLRALPEPWSARAPNRPATGAPRASPGPCASRSRFWWPNWRQTEVLGAPVPGFVREHPGSSRASSLVRLEPRVCRLPHRRGHHPRYLGIGQVPPDPLPARLAYDRFGDAGGDAAQVGDRGKQAAGGEVLVAHLGREAVGRGGEHSLRDLPRLAEERAQPHARKDEDVVPLPHARRAPAVRHGREGAAGGHERAPLRPGDDVRGRGLGLAGRVRQRKIRGRSTPRAISRTTSSVNAPGAPETPMRTVGFSARTTARRSRGFPGPRPALVARETGHPRPRR